MAQGHDGHVVILGGALLDTVRGTLTRDGLIVPLRSKSFRLLCELARNAGRVLSKEELLDAVWPGVAVTEDSLTQSVRDIRRALGEDGPRLLRTVARRGFILCPDTIEPPAPPRGRASLPRIAVLPFLDLTGDLDRAPLVDGLAEEITSGLARFRNLTVVARHSAFAASREGLSLQAIGERLRADYVVDGTARVTAGHLRLALALNDVATSEVLWGDSFDAGDGRWEGLHEIVPRRIVSRLFTSIEEAGHRSSLRRAPRDLSAFEHLVQGKALFRSFEPGVNEKAFAHFVAAIEADPSFGIAHSYHAMVDLGLHDYGLAPPEVKRRAKARAALGVELSPGESRCRSILAYCLALLGEFDAGEREARHAIELNPSDADALFGLAIVLVWHGRSAEALTWIERAKEINPLWPTYYDALLSEALLFLGRYEESARVMRRLPRLSTRQEMRLAAAHALAGQTDLARRHAARARAAEPTWDFVEKVRVAYAQREGEDVATLIRGIELALGLLQDA